MDAAADAAIARVREEAAEPKLELQRAWEGDVAAIILEQAQLLADVELAAASPEGCVAGSEAARCLLAAVTRLASTAASAQAQRTMHLCKARPTTAET